MTRPSAFEGYFWIGPQHDLCALSRKTVFVPPRAVSLRRYIQEQGSADRDFSCVPHRKDVANILLGQQATAWEQPPLNGGCLRTPADQRTMETQRVFEP
jgi:hypothetical protein